MDVDVLCWGGTCRFEAYEMEGKFFINPGSATGAPSWSDGEDRLTASAAEETGAGADAGAEEEDFDPDRTTPSFVLMDVQGEVLVLYVYQLKRDAAGNENVGVEKVSFRKNSGGGGGATAAD
jgi:vacuolar protein sorting-associated protein 29